jgi:hypothetical protein
MRKKQNIYRNWRLWCLGIIAMSALMLLCGETDDLRHFVLIKAVGFAAAYGCYRLGKYWDGKGKINELKALADED